MRLSMSAWVIFLCILLPLHVQNPHQLTSLTKLVLLQTLNLSEDHVSRLIKASAKELVLFETIKGFAENEETTKKIIELSNLLTRELQNLLKNEVFQLVPDLELFLIKPLVLVASYPETPLFEPIQILTILPNLTLDQTILLISWYTYQKNNRPFFFSEVHTQIFLTLPPTIQLIIAPYLQIENLL